MAVIYEKRTPDCVYQVRTAGSSVRLYSNSVLHSQYNPKQVISGAIWDLLLLPAFFKPVAPKKILLLGLGGGTLVKMVQHFFPNAEIDCVELDVHHIRIAKRFFKVKGINIHQGDAYTFLKQNRKKYDWVIDDVFGHLDGNPSRQASLNNVLYKRSLKRDGVLSINIIDEVEGFSSLKKQFKQAYGLRHPLYENEICVFADSLMDEGGFESNLQKSKLLDQRYKTCRLRYELEKLS